MRFREEKEYVAKFVINRSAEKSRCQAIKEAGKYFVIPVRTIRKFLKEAASEELSSNKPRIIRRKTLYDKLSDNTRNTIRSTVWFPESNNQKILMHNAFQIHDIFQPY